MNDVKNLGFKSQPNYQQLRGYFQEEFDKLQEQSKAVFSYDWEKLPEFQQKKKH